MNQGLDPEPLLTLTVLLALAGIVGGRLFYVMEHGGPLLGTRGFTFDGGFILAALVLLVYVVRTRLDVRLLDVVALWLPLGVALGRVGDVINGEHYGDRSDFFLAVRNSHPDALTPDPRFAYANGGLYEVPLGLSNAQRTSVGLLVVAVVGRAVSVRRGRRGAPGSTART